jgi:hypothetical protein
MDWLGFKPNQNLTVDVVSHDQQNFTDPTFSPI